MNASSVQRRFIRAAILTVIAAVTAATMLSTADPAAAAYSERTLVDANGNGYSCPTWSGGADSDAGFVIPCGGSIAQLDDTGKLRKLLDLPNAYPAYRDAAISTDGRYIYWITGALRLDVVTNHAGTGDIRRLTQQADGSYVYDAGFVIPARQLGAHKWGFRSVDTDIHGNVFGSANAYIFEFTSTGAQRSAFGGDDTYLPLGCGGNGADCTSGAGLEIAEGIAVHPDGNRIYVVEEKHHHIQRWDRTGPNSTNWTRSAWTIGNRLQGGPDCAIGRLSAPYDVALDGHGSIFVVNTSCNRVERYDTNGAFGEVVGTLNVGGRTHGFAVNYRGTVIVPGPGDNPGVAGRIYTRVGVPTTCGPDGESPTFGRVTAKRVKGVNAVRLYVPATDRCSAVTQMKIERDHRGAQYFAAYSGSRKLSLTRKGVNQLKITIRDRYGRSAVKYVAVRSTTGATSDRPADTGGGGGATVKPSKGRYGAGTRLRKQVRVWGPKRECARRPERFINTRSYQILDTCARLRGRVLSAERSGSNVVIKVLIGSNVTRRIWRDYPRSAEVYAVGLTRVRGMARLRAGDKIKVSGALVRSRSSNTLSMAPVSYVRSRR